MKKVFLLTGVFLVFLFSFNDHTNTGASFADIIKDDTSRIQELLKTVDSIRRTRSTYRIKDRYKLAKKEQDTIRKDLDRIKVDRNHPAVMEISVQDMQEIISSISEPTDQDSLVFYLGTYKTQEDVDRYNSKTGDAFTLQDLKHCPTILIKTESPNSSSSFNLSLHSHSSLSSVFSLSTHSSSNIIYDVAKICPPPSTCKKSSL